MEKPLTPDEHLYRQIGLKRQTSLRRRGMGLDLYNNSRDEAARPPVPKPTTEKSHREELVGGENLGSRAGYHHFASSIPVYAVVV